MSGFEVAPAELEGAARALRGMGQEAASLGGGHGALGGGGLAGAVEGLCSRALASAGGLHQAGSAVGAGLVGGAAGYEGADRAAMPGQG